MLVSIPNRDFDELQFVNKCCAAFTFAVSIPNRDFDELQLSITVAGSPTAKFQSLIGILMNCNETKGAKKMLLGVPIPNRDFDELQY